MAIEKFVFILFLLVIPLVIAGPLPDQADKKVSAKPSTVEKTSSTNGKEPDGKSVTMTTVTVLLENNETRVENNNKSYVNSINPFSGHINLDNGAVRRTFYVVVALTGVVLLYFAVKGIRMKTKRKTRRYGLLAEQELLEPLDGDDEEEDMTLFEAKRQKKKGRN